MTHSNKEILEHFFDVILGVVSEGTSDNYALMVISQFSKKISKDFPFVKYFSIKNSVKVDEKINRVDHKKVSKFITKLMDSLFSDLFKHLVKRKMDENLYNDLKLIGVKI